MRRHSDGNSSRVPSRPNAFSPEFLEQLNEDPEPLTAAEADLAGPWKVEAVPAPAGGFAVLREWESLGRGDLPEAVFVDKETAALCAAILCLIEREPLFHLEEKEGEGPAGALPAGYPVTAVFGEEGPRECGWLRRFNPAIVAALHLVEALVRTPRSLAEVNLAAGGEALAQVGRYLAERRQG
jgi:hypothetical protein